MGNYSLLLVLAGVFTVSMLLYSARNSTSRADTELADHTFKAIAREGAKTGLNMTIRRLAADTSSWSMNPTSYKFVDQAYRQSIFTTEVQANYSPAWLNGACWVDTVDVVSVGTSTGGRDDGAGNAQFRSHEIRATFVRSCTDSTGGGPPDLFGYPIITDKNLRLERNAGVYSSDANENVDIHSNGAMTINGNPVVQGYGTYASSGGSCSAGCSGFQPNDDVNGADANYLSGSEVDIDPFDPEDYRAGASYVSGDVVFESAGSVVDFTDFNGVTGYGTASDPYLWFVDGNLTFNADVRFEGYGIIVTTGYVTIASNVDVLSGLSSDVTPPSSTSADPNVDATREFMDTYLSGGTSVGLYIGGYAEKEGRKQSLVTSGTSTFIGTIFANETLAISGDMTVYGSMAAYGDLSITGKTVVWYETGHDSILLPLGSGSGVPQPEGVRLLSYVEW